MVEKEGENLNKDMSFFETVTWWDNSTVANEF